jgi:hypothetical protein
MSVPCWTPLLGLNHARERNFLDDERRRSQQSSTTYMRSPHRFALMQLDRPVARLRTLFML